jgi:hypothetical protein
MKAATEATTDSAIYLANELLLQMKLKFFFSCEKCDREGARKTISAV